MDTGGWAWDVCGRVRQASMLPSVLVILSGDGIRHAGMVHKHSRRSCSGWILPGRKERHRFSSPRHTAAGNVGISSRWHQPWANGYRGHSSAITLASRGWDHLSTEVQNIRWKTPETNNTHVFK